MGKEQKLKAYMAYHGPGPQDGAILVFAYTARQAKAIAYPTLEDWGLENYIDIRVRKKKNAPWLFKEKIKDEPHVIESPITCDECECWGHSEIVDGICEECLEDRSERWL